MYYISRPIIGFVLFDIFNYLYLIVLLTFDDEFTVAKTLKLFI